MKPQHPGGMPLVCASHNPYPVDRWREGRLTQELDVVAEEVPIALVFNGVSHAVMLATPQDLADFALGFSLSEGILCDASELYDVEVVERKNGIEVQMTISSQRFFQLKERRRNLAGRTGCGICGTESLTQAIRKPSRVSSCTAVSPAALHQAFAQLGDLQRLQSLTGAVHAAAWASFEGKVELLCEDVGRHNALDKLIGRMVRRGLGFQTGFVMVTSRASCEIVQKAVTVGISLVTAISAPTGLAIRMAQEAGLTLIGFARDRSHVVYADATGFRQE